MRAGTILLVEDSDDDVALTLRAFKKNQIGNPIVVARDGVEALDYLFARGEHSGREATQLPSVILLDLKLPKVDGHEVLAQVRANPLTATVPVVLLTSSREARDIDRGYRIGANSYIRKPVDFDEFIAAMGQVGQYWLHLNVPPAGTTP